MKTLERVSKNYYYIIRGDTVAEASSDIDAGNFANDSGGRKESNWF